MERNHQACGWSRGTAVAVDATNPKYLAQLGPLSELVSVLAEAGRELAGLLLANQLHKALVRIGRASEAADNLRRFAGPEVTPDAEKTDIRHAIGLSNLCLIEKECGNIAAACDAGRRSIAIAERLLGPHHVKLAIHYNNLALALKEAGDIDGAQKQLWHSIAIRRKHLPDDDPSFATQYSNLGLLLWKKSDLPDACEQIRRAIGIQEKDQKADERMFVANHCVLSRILDQMGDQVSAIKELEKAISIDEGYYPADHPMLAVHYANLGDAAVAYGRFRRGQSRIASKKRSRLTKNIFPAAVGSLPQPIPILQSPCAAWEITMRLQRKCGARSKY